MNLPISETLNSQITSLNPLQLAWLSGYCWGKVNATTDATTVSEQGNAQQHDQLSAVPQVTATVTKEQRPKITLISASQTGNARKVAEQLQQLLSDFSTIQLVNAADYKAKQIAQEQMVILVTSTQGEGEPPEEAINLYRYLYGKKAPSLHGVSFAVLGLGDSSYPKFCQAAKDFDQRLAELGAQRLIDIATCDVDYQAQAHDWMEKLHQHLKTINTDHTLSSVNTSSPTIVSHYDKEHPFEATLSVRQKITGRFSEKDVEHIEIDLSGSGLQYQVGDALGVWFDNDANLVDEWLQVFSLNAETKVVYQQQTLSLKELLTHHLELTQTSAKVIQDYASINPDVELQALIKESAKLQAFVQETPLIEVFKQYPFALTAEQLSQLLRPLTPRLYSIASSSQEVGEEVHLTVGVVRYTYNDRVRTGGASGFLGERLPEDGKVKVFIETNPHFRLPSASDKDIIMIGAGTGIAPFRAFMQQRAIEPSSGRNWLFFGNPTFTEDFLYQQEWQSYAKQGILHRYHFAWSRDQERKIYVQDKIREQAQELWLWLQQGAYIYVCGDASKMAKDVEKALLEVISQQGQMSMDEAEDYLADLRQEKRYQRDVY